MKKKILKSTVILAAVFVFFGCIQQKSKGSANVIENTLVKTVELEELKVHEKTVDLKTYKVTVPSEKEFVIAKNVKAKFKKLGIKPVTLNPKEVKLIAGKAVDIEISFQYGTEKDKVFKKTISVTREAGSSTNEDPALTPKSIKIFTKYANLNNWSGEIPEDNSVLVAGNIKAEFNVADVKLAIEGDVVRFNKGETKNVTLKAAAVPGKHKAWSQVISVTRAGLAELELKSLKIHKAPVDKTQWKVEIPSSRESVSISDIEAKFNIPDVNLTIKEGTVAFADGETKNITLEAAPVTGKHTGWGPKVISVKREKQATVNVIDIKGLFVGNKIVVNPEKAVVVNTNSVVIKANVPGGVKYESFMIDGEEADYTAAPDSYSVAFYTKTISGLVENEEKVITITVTDSRCVNSPFTKKLKVKYESGSEYSLIPLQYIFVGEKELAETAINGAEVTLDTGAELSFDVILTKKPVQPYRESVKFTVGTISKTEVLKGKKASFDFSSIKSGTHNVKVERLVDDEVVKTYNFKVVYSQALQEIDVSGIIINNVPYKKSVTFPGQKALYTLENEEYTEEFQLKETDTELSVTVEIKTPDVKAVMTNNSGEEIVLSGGSASKIPISNEENRVKISLTKAGLKPRVFSFNAIKKVVKIGSVVVDGKSYTWDEFKAVQEIQATGNNVNISVSWLNTEPFEEISLKKKGNSKNLFNVDLQNKTASANVELTSAETELIIKLYIQEVPWRKHQFKVLKPGSSSPESNAKQKDVIDEWFIYNITSLGKKLDRPKYAEDADTIDLYVEPEADDITGVELIEPKKQAFKKEASAQPDDPVYYKTTITGFTTGSKITYKIIAKDGTEKVYGLNEGKNITLQSYIKEARIRYDAFEDIDSHSPFVDVKGNGPYEYNCTLEEGQSEVYFKFSVLEGCDNITFADSRFSVIKQRTVGKLYKYTEYLVKADVSDLQTTGGNFNLEIPIVYINPVSMKRTDIRTYTVQVEVPKK